MSRRDISIRLSCAALLGLCLFSTAAAQKQKDPVDYVDPNIGGIGQLLQPTYPLVYLPYAMMRISPITTPGIKDRYLADKIYGFPGGGSVVMMPTSGLAETEPDKYASLYDHDLETATPYYYAVLLEKYNVQVEYTVSERAAFYRFAFPADNPAHVLFSVRSGSDLKMVGTKAISGSQRGMGGQTYFYAEFSESCLSSREWQGMQVPRNRNQQPAQGLGIVADFPPGRRVNVRVGISYISVEQAQKSLEREIPTWDFEHAKAQARAVWSKALNQIAVKGGTEEQRTIFYTGLYRAFLQPVNWAEGIAITVPWTIRCIPSAGMAFIPTSASLWGSYRCQHPLQLLLDSRRQEDFVRSFLELV